MISQRPLLILILLWFCIGNGYGQSIKNGSGIHSITGIAHGIKDSTWLYLEAMGETKFIDSARVINDRFYLKKKYSSSSLGFLWLRTKNYSDYVSLWLDEGDILISVVKGDFRNAVVIGSASQLLVDKMNKIQAPLMNERDSLMRIADPDNGIKEKILRVETSIQELPAELIADNPGQLLSAYYLSFYCSTWGREKTSNLYKSLSAANKLSKFGREVKRYLDLNKNTDVGQAAPAFKQKTMKGKHTGPADYAGKLLLLEFWSSYCGPCRKENPNLVALHRKYSNKGFDILGVSLDDNEQAWKKAVAMDSLSWEQVAELNGSKNAAALIYGVYELPTNFLIDTKGKIIAKNVRGQALASKLIELLGE